MSKSIQKKLYNAFHLAVEKPHLTVLHCNPWEGFMREIATRSELECRQHELEQDLQWEVDNGLRNEETDVEAVDVDLLPEIQRCNAAGSSW